MRHRPPVELFQRPGWPAALQVAGIKTRLLNREAWPGGLTAAERVALEAIAEGKPTELGLAPQAARLALEAPHLESHPTQRSDP
jgi:hypothetical protein